MRSAGGDPNSALCWHHPDSGRGVYRHHTVRSVNKLILRMKMFWDDVSMCDIE